MSEHDPRRFRRPRAPRAGHAPQPTREPSPLRTGAEGGRFPEREAAGLAGLLDVAPVEVFFFDPDGLAFRRANRRALHNTGYSIDELRRLKPDDLHPDLEPGAYERQLEPLRAGRTECVHIEGVHRRKNGSIYPVEEQVRMLDDGAEPCFVSIVVDHSERHHAEEERQVLEQALRRAQRLETIGTFTCGIVHDLNNLLTPLLGQAENMRDALPEQHPLQADTAEIFETAIHARDLVGQILRFARRGERGSEFGPVDLRGIVRDALRLIRSSLPQNIEVETHLGQACPWLWGDAGQIHQLVMNLCMNARNAIGDEDGRLVIRVEPIEVTEAFAAEHPTLRPGPYSRLLVRDDGCGIERGDLERIFDPFFSQGDHERTGLGLTVVREIVVRHGGEVIVDSEVSVGTTFWIYLPTSADATDPGGR